MGALRPIHWVIFLVIVLLLFGAKRLPDLAKSVGQSLKIFKKEIKELTEDDAPPPVQPQTHQQPGATAAGGPAIPLDTTNPAARTDPSAAPGSVTPPKV